MWTVSFAGCSLKQHPSLAHRCRQGAVHPALRGGEADAAIHTVVLDRHAASRLAMTVGFSLWDIGTKVREDDLRHFLKVRLYRG
jgi:hypothetical protein